MEAVYTRGRDLVALLHAEARRRSDVAALVERAATLSDEDIAAVNVPLPWYRKALTMLRDRSAVKVREADIEQGIRSFFAADPSGIVYEFTGETIFVRDRCASGEIQVPTGKLFFVLDAPERPAVEMPSGMGDPLGKDHNTHVLWIDTVSCDLDPRLLSNSVKISASTKLGYRDIVQQRLQRLYPNAPMTVDCSAPTSPAGSNHQPLSHLGVTIKR